MTGQPLSNAKETKPVADVASSETVAPDMPPSVDSKQPQEGTPDTSDVPALPIPTGPDPIVVAAASPLPVPTPAEVTADPAPVPELGAITSEVPTSARLTSTVAADVPSQSVDATDTEKTPRSAEAIEATLAAHADKNKKLEAEKPTSTAAERTLDTPAAFRSAAGVERPAPKSETPKADIPEQAAAATPKETVPATKTSPGDSDRPDAKPTTAASQPSPDPAPDAPVQPAPLQANTAPQQMTQPAAVQPDLTRHVPVAGLAVEIAAHAQAGRNRFEIRLDPPELGRIDVRLDVGNDGQVTSHLRVERAETLDLLRRDAPMLERALQQAGLRTSDNGLQFSLRDQSFSWQQQGRETPEMARLVVADEAPMPAETPHQYGRLAGLGSGVDIRV